jgi:alkylhydroperoxidase family enzyme
VDDGAKETMLSEQQVRELEAWLRSAKLWAESSQAMVGAATGLTNASRSLAGQLEGPSASHFSDEGARGARLATQLRLLAETIEDEGRELRDRYLTTEAEIALYTNLLD